MTLDELRSRLTISVPEAAEILGLGTGSAAYRAAHLGYIPGAIQIGTQWRVSALELRRALGDLSDETGGSAA